MFTELRSVGFQGKVIMVTGGGTGIGKMTIENRERLEVHPKPIDALLTIHHDNVVVDNICAIEIEGKVGFCDFETGTDIRRRDTVPLIQVAAAAFTNGLTRR